MYKHQYIEAHILRSNCYKQLYSNTTTVSRATGAIHHLC